MRRGTVEDAADLKRICKLVGMPGANARRWLADPRNIVLIEDDNAVLFLWRWVGIYEGHVLFTTKGKMAIGLGALCLDLMFKSGAQMILAVISDTLPHAGWFVRQLGFSCRGEIETIEGPSKMYQLEAAQWA